MAGQNTAQRNETRKKGAENAFRSWFGIGWLGGLGGRRSVGNKLERHLSQPVTSDKASPSGSNLTFRTTGSLLDGSNYHNI